MRTCKIEGCEKKHYAHGWCQMHYKRWQTSGNVGQAELLHKHHTVLERMCTRCGELLPATNEYFCKDKQKRDGLSSRCKKCHSNIGKAANKKLRLQVLEYYSDGILCCACCGEAHIEFMTLDHINGDGKEHRAKVGHGPAMYRWIIANDYPPMFEVLCHNCNWSKGIRGYCPHEREREVELE